MDIVVIDYGSQTFRAGFADGFPSDNEPRVQTPCAVESSAPGTPHAAQNASSTLAPQLIHPVQRGEVADMDALEALIHYSLYELLGWEQGFEGTVMVSEPLLTSRRCRELLAQLMFEVFNVQAFYSQDQATLALYAVAKVTGCVVDIGHGKTDVATVTEGQTNMPVVQRLAFGGQDMTEMLRQLLAARGVQLPRQEDVEHLKHQCCRAADSSNDLQQMMLTPAARAPQQPQADDSQLGSQGGEAGQPVTYALPDGQSITVTTEGYQVAEALLDPAALRQWPQLAGHPQWEAWGSLPPLPHLVSTCLVDTLANADALNKRAGQLKDVLVCGGSALIPGLSKRLVQQLKQLCPQELSPSLCEVPDYIPTAHALQHAAWLGGAVLARVNAQQNYWVTRSEYEDCGPGIVGRKCN